MTSFFNRLIGAAKFDAPIFEEIKNDPEGLKQGFALIMAVSLLTSVGVALEEPNQSTVQVIVLGFVLMFVILSLYLAFFYVVGARWLPHPEPAPTLSKFFRTTSFSFAPGLLLIVAAIPGIGPFLAEIISLWCMAALWAALRVALGYSSVWAAVGLTLVAGTLLLAPGIVFALWFMH